MRKAMIGMLLVLAPAVWAEVETLTGGSFESGGYGGPVYKVGLIGDEIGLFSGGRGGWIINHTFVVGGGGYSTMFDVETDLVDEGGETYYLRMNYGGFEMEYIHNSDRVLHWTVHLTLGGGSASLRLHDPDYTEESDHFYIVEPSVNMDVNVTDWFRLGFGASYHAVFGVDLTGMEDSDLGGPSGQIVFKFGHF